jgi:uncharacterized protein (UPF0261 family)
MPVVIVGTLDTKGDEVAFVRDVLRAEGLQTLVIDAGSGLAWENREPFFIPEYCAEAVFNAAGTSTSEVRLRRDRGEAVAAAARGVVVLVNELKAKGWVDGILGLGGSAGTVIATAAMRELPFGLPKVMVSTLASGQTRPFVGGSDIMMLYPVADLAGLNRLTRSALTNAAMALAGMVKARKEVPAEVQERPLIAATMFGVTTPCVDFARRQLERSGLEVVVFHATGVGGQSMEGLVRDGRVSGLLDLTTTELADELVGGILSAGPGRLEAAVRSRTPQVVSVGALDMVNFGPMETVPDRFAGRQFHVHNASVTLMRTTPEENATLGTWIARVLADSTSPAVVMIPLRGVSALDAPGGPFHDPDADRALFDTLTSGLEGHAAVRVESRDEHINDPSFAGAAARNLLDLLGRPFNP